MKRVLVSWYGITDLRAALGQVESGPVFDALRTGNYSAAVVLCYTDQQVAAPVDIGPDRYQTIDVRAIANTQEAHNLFEAQLQVRLAGEQVDVVIRTCPVSLEHLNDTVGIFHAAAAAIQLVRSEYAGQAIDVFLSPGTSAMAFTWGLAVLVNQGDDLRAIASSDPRQPPAPLVFPKEMLHHPTWACNPSSLQDMGRFDVIYHLYGEQRIPSGIIMREFECQEHVFVTDRTYQSTVMRHLLPPGGRKCDIHIDPFDPKSVEAAIVAHARSHPGRRRVGVHLTGGTKLMYAGGLAAATTLGAVPFYLNGRHQTIIRMDTWQQRRYNGMCDVDDYLHLSGLNIRGRGVWADSPLREQRLQHTRRLWGLRKPLSRIYKQASEFNDAPQPFSVQAGPVSATLSPGFDGVLQIGSTRLEFPCTRDFARYISGGWLEEFVHDAVAASGSAGRIIDLRLGTCVAWPDSGDLAQEFDILATNGRNLFIVECKAGMVRSEDVYKLQQVVRTFGGVEAKGILASAFPPAQHVRRRIASDPRLALACGDDLARDVLRAME